MNPICSICFELFNANDKLNSTPCGHIFHPKCLQEWMQSSKTCPECRKSCQLESLIPIYLNSGSSLDISESEDPPVLLGRIFILTKDIADKNTTIQNSNEEINRLKTTVKNFEEELQDKNQLISSMRNENESLQTLQSECDELRAQVNSLSIERIIQVSSADVNEILAIDSNPRSLATSVAQLKRDLAESVNQNNKLEKYVTGIEERCIAQLRNTEIPETSEQACSSKTARFIAENERYTLLPDVKSSSILLLRNTGCSSEQKRVIVLLEPNSASPVVNVPTTISTAQKVQVNVVLLDNNQQGWDSLALCAQDLISNSNAAKIAKMAATENLVDEAVPQSDFDHCFGSDSFDIIAVDDSQPQIISGPASSHEHSEAVGFDFSMFDIDPYEDPEMALALKESIEAAAKLSKEDEELELVLKLSMEIDKLANVPKNPSSTAVTPEQSNMIVAFLNNVINSISDNESSLPSHSSSSKMF